MRFMTIECSRSVHSIVLRMAQVNSNVFYKCYKYKKGGLFCQEVCGERFSDPAIDGVRSAVNGSGQLCRQRFTVRQLWHFRGKKPNIFCSNDLSGIISQPHPFCTHWVSRHNIS